MSDSTYSLDSQVVPKWLAHALPMGSTKSQASMTPSNERSSVSLMYPSRRFFSRQSRRLRTP
ncbi:MAG: hypothetical protein JW913_08465 [Chitinispirillaceae bacterium]|nr:hypothetical protein [Chitinispirillaceae bacterium]